MAALDWDDLRVALAVADAGSLAGAARALDVNHTTALRRLDALEARLNTRLFERQRGGYVPTEAGDLLAQEARAIAPRIDDIERRLLGRDLRLTGTLRLTTAFVTMVYLLPQALAAFANTHPGIEVEVAESTALLDLRGRERARSDADLGSHRRSGDAAVDPDPPRSAPHCARPGLHEAGRRRGGEDAAEFELTPQDETRCAAA